MGDQVPEEQIQKIKQAVSLFDREELPTVEQLGAVFKALGQDLEPQKLQFMIDYVKQERNSGLVPNPADSMQSIFVGDAKPNETRALRSKGCEDGLKNKKDLGSVRGNTLDEYMEKACQVFADNKCVGAREVKEDGTLGEYKWFTYRETFEMIVNFGKAMVHKFNLKKGDRVGINSKTRLEWTVAKHAHLRQGMVTTTLYSTFGPDALQYIVDHSELNVIITETPDLFLVNKSRVRALVVIGNITDATRQKATENNVELVTFNEMLEYGKSIEKEDKNQTTPDDEIFIIYTSGTTGNPKGVVHTQGRWLSSTSFQPLDVRSDDVYLSFLPMAHIMELLLQDVLFFGGAAVGFYNGNPLTLLEDAQILKPTMFVPVPRVINRIYSKILANLSQLTGLKKILTDLAIESKKAQLPKGRVRSFWDFLVFNKIAEALGGRVRVMATGSAPTAPEILDFFRIAFSASVREGYGMTEILVTNLTLGNDFVSGAVGPPEPMIEMKLVSVEEMGYSVNDQPVPRGELCCRGYSVMKCYHKDEEKTKESFDSDGWFRTGDIAAIMPNGAIKIVDRVKNIFKLSQGEYVAPEKLENLFVRSNFVAQIFVYGSSLKHFLVAVVVPDPEFVLPWAKTQPGMESLTPQQLIEHPDFKKAVLADLEKTGRSAGMNGYEMIREVHFSLQPFSIENNLLTPTFKLKRNIALVLFKEPLDKIIESFEKSEKKD
eukprot:TRINITY_DN12012_c0_g1_i1.p1 TRINITY_DN12012_c0_g1~~TRINITY_DN12012_c0_g1_i1.p1  ORF type:complete len:716 (-),score=149.06 TRINITY_DN12012_c0_g1_i1:79-2226(-)